MASQDEGEDSISLTWSRYRSFFHSEESEEEPQRNGPLQHIQNASHQQADFHSNQANEENGSPQDPPSHSVRGNTADPGEPECGPSFALVRSKTSPQGEEYVRSEQGDAWGPYSEGEDPDAEETYGSHTNSKTWSSWEQKIMDKWRTIQPKLMRMYPTERSTEKICPFVPRDGSQWVQHVTEINAAEKAALERKMALYEESKRLGFPDVYMTLPFLGKRFGAMEDGDDKPMEVDEFQKKVVFKYSRNPPTRGYVLGERTIWCPAPSVPWRRQPAWPCKAEMEWEGDQRVATENGRFGRFPPLPRVDPNNDSVAWHINPRLRPYPFDDPWAVPTMEDVYLPVDQIEDAEVSSLLNQCLLDELDNPPIPVRTRNAHKSYITSFVPSTNTR
jgi:hypothetical protein